MNTESRSVKPAHRRRLKCNIAGLSQSTVPHRARYRLPFVHIAAILISLVTVPGRLYAQDSVSLTQCYALLDQNYPLVKQKQLIAHNFDLNKQAIEKNFLPQVSLNAQATYQSDVPHVPISTPGIEIPTPNKDQYRATVDVNQLLYDGGALHNSIQVQELNSRVRQEQVEVSLHQLKARINERYFSILFSQEKNKLLALTMQNLKSRLSEVRSAVRNGAALPSADDVIQAEILRTQQQIYENKADREATLQALSDLIGITLEKGTVLRQTDLTVNLSSGLSRPELQLYNLQQQQTEVSSNLLGKSKAPKFMLFAQGGYGNPGLNLLDNTFQTFFMGGVKLSWNLVDWNMVNNQRQALLINKEIIESDRQVFDLNTNTELNRYRTEMEKLNHLIDTDEEIINVRKKVAQTSRAQLQNGTLTASEYLLDYNALQEAMVTKKTHEISLLLAKANYIITQGTSIEP
jgi:outer membrane protein TolC